MDWLTATLEEIVVETPTARTLTFDVPGWPGHGPGQHIDIRLTAEDGYSTQRSYSLAAPKDGTRIAVTVQNVADGEVSPYLVENLEVGDQLKLRGPVGRWFVWHAQNPAPVMLIAGGSGIVPLRSMIRDRAARGLRTPFRLIYSVREESEIYYSGELRKPEPGLDTQFVYTRVAPEPSRRPVGRLTASDIDSYGWPSEFQPTCFVCGPTGFVEAAADVLVSRGHASHRIKTERFGPTGT